MATESVSFARPEEKEYTPDGAYIVDLRSDVLTRPTEAMREAMSSATFKDDVYGEDPTVIELQKQMATLFGMEATLYVPSGTMGNLIGVMAHCNFRGAEVILGHNSHLVLYEQGGLAQIGGITARTLPNKADGTFDLDTLETLVRPKDDPHQPLTAAIAIENTHGSSGGKVLPMDFLKKLRALANDLGLPIHMDGARVLNAAVAMDVHPSEILQYIDSVSVCLSKGVGAPIGSILGGTATVIDRAVRLRKVLGGGWRQPGPLAAAALVALRDYRQRLAADHSHTKLLANAIQEKCGDVLGVVLEDVHTDILMIRVVMETITAEDFVTRLSQVTEAEEKCLGHKTVVMGFAENKQIFRFVMCHNISSEDVQLTVDKLTYIAREMSSAV